MFHPQAFEPSRNFFSGEPALPEDFLPAAIALSILAAVFLFAFIADMRNARRRSTILRQVYPSGETRAAADFESLTDPELN